ncbi:hypothetical protein [uncultured Jatrophihabitans sp.]|uniref:hypothetical protein n=1 Tax=uncultured Jatrophihabitans sp. TaxID=1610747 RepID=UPI0035CBC592
MPRRPDVGGAAHDNDDELIAMLHDAATAPGRPHELHGVEAPLRALRATQQEQPAPARRGRVRARVAAATLATKVVVVGIVLAAGAGAAVAGATGHLPGQRPTQDHPHQAPTSETTRPGSAGPSSSRSASTPASRGPSRSSSASHSRSRSTAAPSPKLPSVSASVSVRVSPPPGRPGTSLRPTAPRATLSKPAGSRTPSIGG